MIKKIKDIKLAEIKSFCEANAYCKDCPLFFWNEFGYKDCLMTYPHCITNDILEKEIVLFEENNK